MTGDRGPSDGNSPQHRYRTAYNRARATRLAAGMATATIIVAGCSGGGAGHGARGTTVTTAAPTSSTAAPGSSVIPSDRSASTPPSARPASAGPASAGSAALPFAADTNPDVSTQSDGNPVLVSVTKGIHDGYVRYVFLFRHSDPDGHQPWRQFARPVWDVRYVPQGDAVHDPSGEPVANVGAPAHLRIRFRANMHDGADGQNTLQASVSDEDALVFGGDFEGTVLWFYGSDRERPFRVFYVGDGRVAVDIVD